MYYQLKTLTATKKLAQMITKCIVPNFVIALNGDLGAGKTTLVREVLHTLGIKGSIKSPTFTYVEPYIIDGLQIYHFDLYRFTDQLQWYDLGFDEYFSGDFISFIEWASNAGKLIPVIDWEINLAVKDTMHNCQISAYTKKGQECLMNLMANGVDLSV